MFRLLDRFSIIKLLLLWYYILWFRLWDRFFIMILFLLRNNILLFRLLNRFFIIILFFLWYYFLLFCLLNRFWFYFIDHFLSILIIISSRTLITFLFLNRLRLFPFNRRLLTLFIYFVSFRDNWSFFFHSLWRINIIIYLFNLGNII